MTPTTLARAPFHLAVLGVTVLSLLPVDTVSIVDLWDKLEHTAAYTVLALLGTHAYSGAARALPLGAVLIVWGAVLELLQQMVPGRVCDPFDLAANAVGVALGLATSRLVSKVLGPASREVGGTPDQQ